MTRRNTIGVISSVDPNSTQAATQSDASHSHIRRRKLPWILLCLAAVLLIIASLIVLPMLIVKNKVVTVESVTTATKLTTARMSTITTTSVSVSLTDTTTQTAVTSERTKSSPSASTTTQRVGVQIPLGTIDGTAYAVFKTSAGRDSTAAAIPTGPFSGQYQLAESPSDALDDYLETKYLNRGLCPEGYYNLVCGLETGLYFELKCGATLVTGLRVCTANDSPERDPIKVTLEGSNQSGSALTKGYSWTLLFKGSLDLVPDPGRHQCGAIQWFNNSVAYKSYRFLVTDKRASSNSVQYSEMQLFA